VGVEGCSVSATPLKRASFRSRLQEVRDRVRKQAEMRGQGGGEVHGRDDGFNKGGHDDPTVHQPSSSRSSAPYDDGPSASRLRPNRMRPGQYKALESDRGKKS
jgi:hypothetical protein